MNTRPDKRDHTTLSEESWAVHGGNRTDGTTGAIRSPIVMANSYRLPPEPTTLDDADPDLLVYISESGANQLGLQAKLAAMEHGEAAAVFGTGMAALHAAFFTLLKPGDHAIVTNVVYMWLYAGVRGIATNLRRPEPATGIAACLLVSTIQASAAHAEQVPHLVAATRQALADTDDPDQMPASDPLPVAVTLLRDALAHVSTPENAARLTSITFATLGEADRNIVTQGLLE